MKMREDRPLACAFVSGPNQLEAQYMYCAPPPPLLCGASVMRSTVLGGASSVPKSLGSQINKQTAYTTHEVQVNSASSAQCGCSRHLFAGGAARRHRCRPVLLNVSILRPPVPHTRCGYTPCCQALSVIRNTVSKRAAFKEQHLCRFSLSAPRLLASLCLATTGVQQCMLGMPNNMLPGL